MTQFDQVLYIASVGYSGSTLLSMMLNQNPLVSSLGEVYLISEHDRNNWPCTCGELLGHCRFWSPVLDDLRIKTENSALTFAQFPLTLEAKNQSIFRKIPSFADALLVLGNKLLWDSLSGLSYRSSTYARTARNARRLYDTVAAVHGTPVLVDSSKYALPLKSIYLGLRSKMKIIYLVRDGRAVTASLMSRQNLSVSQAAAKWGRFNWNLQLVLRSVPKDQVLTVRYEDLCRHTIETLDEICRFSGKVSTLRGTTIMKELSHDIGGNPMRNRKQETEIVLDETWKRRLTENDLKIFDSHAGRMNEKFGYR